MGRVRVSPSLLISVAALFFSLAGAGMAATGDPFVLGQSNTATAKTSLSAKLGGSTLQLTNNSIKNGATALTLNTTGGPPLVTNTPTTATNLSADYLDGIDSTAFAQRGDLASASGAIPVGDATGRSLGSLELTLTCASPGSIDVTAKDIGSSSARYEAFGIGSNTFTGIGHIGPGDQVAVATLNGHEGELMLWTDGSETISVTLGNVTTAQDTGCQAIGTQIRTT